MQTEIPQPWVCQIIPDLIELASQGSKVVPTKSVIGITGYNYVDKNVPALVVVDETGATIPSVVLYAYRKSPYELQINMQDADFKAVPARARLELRWPNVPDRCAIAIVLPAAPAPVAEFKGEPRDGKAPLSVVFTDLSTNNPTSWKWDFGDGETSTQQRPTHAYSRVGTFTVKLTATNAQGSNTAQKNAYVTVSAVAPPPTAQFTADRRNGTAPLQVTFRDQSTGSPTTWRWEFGDGTTSAAQNPIHTYANPGTYSVKLTASNAQGSDIEDKREFIVVTAAPRPSPVAKFSGTPLTGDVPRTVTFRDESENTPTSWKWEFGDGTTSTVRNPSHTYSVKGAYTVKLTATNASGSNTAQKSNYIVLTNPWRQTASIGPFGGPFGSWQTKEMCPSGQFVFGISLRVEGDQGWGDDTGLNGIRLSCGTAAYSTDISSHTGYWGGWSERAVCSTGLFVTGAQLRIEGSQGIGDDAGAVDAKFVCQNGSSITGSTHHGWGTWKEWQSCPVGSAICGIETRVEGKQDGGDDTGLNDARFYCCSLP